MKGVLDQVLDTIGAVLLWAGEVIRQVVEFALGGVFTMMRLDFMNLPTPKQVLYVIAVGALVWILYRVFRPVLEFARSLFSILGTLIQRLSDKIPEIAIALVVAWVCAHMVTTFDMSAWN